ncbi:MAG: hypothetical protein R2911_40135 [Caldilineaceae bacterium]
MNLVKGFDPQHIGTLATPAISRSVVNPSTWRWTQRDYLSVLALEDLIREAEIRMAWRLGPRRCNC